MWNTCFILEIKRFRVNDFILIRYLFKVVLINIIINTYKVNNRSTRGDGFKSPNNRQLQ